MGTDMAPVSSSTGMLCNNCVAIFNLQSNYTVTIPGWHTLPSVIPEQTARKGIKKALPLLEEPSQYFITVNFNLCQLIFPRLQL